MKKWTAHITAAVAAVITAATVVLPISAAPAGAAPSAPFTDPSAHGTLGFCSPDNTPVTSGTLVAEPFVWKAVSTVPAPAGYTESWLVLVQPIQHEDPSLWTPYDLNGNSTFSNPHAPAAQSIGLDPPLLSPYNSLPPYWNGYYQVRMYFAAPQKEAVITPYPAAVIQVKGKEWSLVSGGKVDCANSSAVSKLAGVLPKSVIDTPQTVVVGGKKPSPATPKKAGQGASSVPTATTRPPASRGTTGHGRSSPASASTATTTTTSTQPAPSRVAAAAGGSRSGGGGSAWWIAVVAAAVVLIGAGVAIVRKRSRPSARI